MSVANSTGIPYPVLFKDFEGMNFAAYRSAMLEAWRVFKARRKWLGESFCQPNYRMIIEEAWLRGEIKANNFYQNLYRLTSADWIGPPKGQIEPVKEEQADKIAVDNNFKTLEEVYLERGREMTSTFKQIKVERDLQETLGITPLESQPVEDSEDSNDSGDGGQSNDRKEQKDGN